MALGRQAGVPAACNGCNMSTHSCLRHPNGARVACLTDGSFSPYPAPHTASRDLTLERHGALCAGQALVVVVSALAAHSGVGVADGGCVGALRAVRALALARSALLGGAARAGGADGAARAAWQGTESKRCGCWLGTHGGRQAKKSGAGRAGCAQQCESTPRGRWDDRVSLLCQRMHSRAAQHHTHSEHCLSAGPCKHPSSRIGQRGTGSWCHRRPRRRRYTLSATPGCSMGCAAARPPVSAAS